MQIRCCNFFYHFGELVLRFSDTFPIVGIYNKYEALGVLEIVPPEGSNFVLTADIPNGETDVFVFHGLHIETWKKWQFFNTSKFQFEKASAASYNHFHEFTILT